MDAPKIILLLLYASSLTISFVKHGQPSVHHAGYSTIACALVMALLLWGGFFQ